MAGSSNITLSPQKTQSSTHPQILARGNPAIGLTEMTGYLLPSIHSAPPFFTFVVANTIVIRFAKTWKY